MVKDLEVDPGYPGGSDAMTMTRVLVTGRQEGQRCENGSGG